MASVSSRVCDDSVKYMLFPAIRTRNKASTGREVLELFAENYILKLSSYLCQYIWQDQPFNLFASTETPDLPPHLEGVTYFGDNIEDEWFIVYLLFLLTQEDPDLVVKVEDSDGEFLLIEAADSLPKWVNPKTSKNRVFIYRGSLHLIPIARSPAEITPIPSGTPSVANAVSAVRQFSTVTEAQMSIQQAVKKRIQGYPQRLKQFQHRAHCFVPASVAAILKEEPRLLSSAIKAFYLRDPFDMKVCRAMKYFPPETRVMTEVLFTKCLYAQLLSQKYEPDKCTGWNLPVVNDPLFKAYDLGMKLSCGFEILMSKAKKKQDIDDVDIKDIDFSNDVRWKRFASSLKEKGYFRGEIDGSQLHRQLMSQAKDFYLQSLKTKGSDTCPGNEVSRLLETITVNYEELKEAEQFLQAPDDDSWMDISPELLDSTLDSIANSNQMDIATAIPNTLKAFLQHPSGIEGVDFPVDNGNKKKKQKVNLDPEAFSEAVSNILDFRVPDSDGDSDSSSMSGYSNDDSDNIELGEESSPKGSNKRHDPKSEAKELMSDMKDYMEQMDREIAATNVGRSFERVQPQTGQSIMDGNESGDIDEEEDDFHPVDIDLTALKNILESYSSQHGLPGPASNLFNSVGIQLPHDADS